MRLVFVITLSVLIGAAASALIVWAIQDPSPRFWVWLVDWVSDCVRHIF